MHLTLASITDATRSQMVASSVVPTLGLAAMAIVGIMILNTIGHLTASVIAKIALVMHC
jgi:hypothetical protein